MQNKILEKHNSNKLSQKFLKITDFFHTLLSLCKGNSLTGVLANNNEMVDIINKSMESASHSFGIVKFILTLVVKLTTNKNKDEQCLLLCTLAYEFALIKTIQENPDIIIKIEPDKLDKLKKELLNKKDIKINIDKFDFDFSMASDFLKEADNIAFKLFDCLGINEPNKRFLINSIHLNYSKGISEIRSDGTLSEKFSNMINYVNSRSKVDRAKIILNEYAHYKKWLFDTKPLYPEKGFSLRNIYIRPRCASVIYQDGKASREYPGYPKLNLKDDVAQIVLYYIQKKEFNSFISVNGTAGSGKSSFTLSLCSELLHHGFIPIRIPFKMIKFDTTKTYFSREEIYDILGSSISFKDQERYGDFCPQVIREIFCKGDIFNERILAGNTYISPYILILDGWDELTTEIQKNMKNFLRCLRDTFINNQNNTIRVILTGRPSRDVNNFLHNLETKTPSLTLKQLNPSEFRLLIDKLSYFNPLPEETKVKLIEKYQSYGDDEFDVLKSPMIAFILHELLTDSNHSLNVDELFNNKAILYKILADMTCENAGKRKEANSEKFDSRLYGKNLRKVLNKTAAIITIKGEELVTYDDLKKLLESNELDIAEDDISKIIVSYYFKGKHYNAGCEFIHKSFREYFYAECIFNTLEDYYSNFTQQSKNNTKYLFDGSDFKENSNLYKFSRDIVKLLSTHYLMCEERNFLVGLLENSILKNSQTDALNFISVIRRGLEALWGWFISRAAINYSLDKKTTTPPLHEITEEIMKLSLSPKYDLNSIYTLLGHNLLLLNNIFNEISLKKDKISSLSDINLKIHKNASGKNRHLVKVDHGSISSYIFAPIGATISCNDNYARNFSNLLSSIEKSEKFHFDCCYFPGARFYLADLSEVTFDGCYLDNVIIENSNFSHTSFRNSIIPNIKFISTNISSSDFIRCLMNNAHFENNNLNEAYIEDCYMNKSIFKNNFADGINISGTEMKELIASNVSLKRAGIKNSDLKSSKFTDSNLEGISFFETLLNSSIFTKTSFSGTNFSNSQLTNVKINTCDIGECVFSNTELAGVRIVNSKLYKVNFGKTSLNKCQIKDSLIDNCRASKKMVEKCEIINQTLVPFIEK